MMKDVGKKEKSVKLYEETKSKECEEHSFSNVSILRPEMGEWHTSYI